MKYLEKFNTFTKKNKDYKLITVHNKILKRLELDSSALSLKKIPIVGIYKIFKNLLIQDKIQLSDELMVSMVILVLLDKIVINIDKSKLLYSELENTVPNFKMLIRKFKLCLHSILVISNIVFKRDKLVIGSFKKLLDVKLISKVLNLIEIFTLGHKIGLQEFSAIIHEKDQKVLKNIIEYVNSERSNNIEGLLLKENVTSIREVINSTAQKYMKNYNCTLLEINDGFCYDFAQEVQKKLGYSRKDLYILNTAMFSSDYSTDMVEALYKDKMNWSKSMLDKYGKPPVDLKTWRPNDHEWIVFKNRHYDAECPNGVDKWYELPIIQRYMKGKIIEESIQYTFKDSYNEQRYKPHLNKINNAKIGDILDNEDIYLFVEYLVIQADKFEDCFVYGDLGDRLEEYEKYKLKEIPIDKLNLNEWDLDEDYVEEYKNKYLENKDYPPIVVDSDYGIIDGLHRANALKKLGLEKIMAFIGI